MLRIAFCAICPVSAPEINRHDGYVTRLGEAGPISAVKIGRRHAKTLSKGGPGALPGFQQRPKTVKAPPATAATSTSIPSAEVKRGGQSFWHRTPVIRRPTVTTQAGYWYSTTPDGQ